MTNRYGVRRFTDAGIRPDCFEVYDRQTGECASFGMYRYEAERQSKCMNLEARGLPCLCEQAAQA